MSKKEQEKSKEKEISFFAEHFPILYKNFVPILIVPLGIIILFSLLSFNNNDLNVISNATAGKTQLPQNFFGHIGAYVSKTLFFLFGGVSYVLPIILILGGVRGFFLEKMRFHWEYIFAVFMIIFGLSLFFGVFPNSIPNPVDNGISAGVVGQRLSSPETPGWVYRFLNKPGCITVALSFFFAGFIIIWLNDWHDLFMRKIRESLNNQNEKINPLKKDENPLEQADISSTNEERIEKKGFFERFKKGEIKENGLAPGLKGVGENNILKRPIIEAKSPALFDVEKEVQANVPQSPITFIHQPTPQSQPIMMNQSPPNLSPIPVPSQPQNSPLTAMSKGVNSSSQMEDPVSGERRNVQVEGNVDVIDYKLPPLNLLSEGNNVLSADNGELETKREILQSTLESFKVNAQVSQITAGPRVALFEILPDAGVNVSSITKLRDNIAMNLKAESLRMITPIPGKNTMGLEVPNAKAAAVSFRKILEDSQWKSSGVIPLGLGRNIEGKAIFLDLAKAPHLLIAGATGSGKSVCMNTIIASLLFRFTPEELKMILVDPKQVEFKMYENLPHLVTPVINDPKRVTAALQWACKEMDRRYKILAQVGVKNLDGFNNRPNKNELKIDAYGKPIPLKMPILVVIIDELADIMMTAKGDVETCLARIAQLGRASGIHAIVATQRPSVNVITGIIKANFPTRIAFRVSSGTDSRTILNSNGAEQLLGSGDMLLIPPGASNMMRIQGAFVPDNELEDVVKFSGAQMKPSFDMSITKTAEDFENEDTDKTPSLGFSDLDVENSDESLYNQAIEWIKRDKRATISHIQRRLKIGYNKAATLIEELEERGIIGPQIGSGATPREILIPTYED